jgi:glycosyltransferase involved in cell wall biosynthesis
MKLRLGWLADAEDADTYSARETRVLLRALARRSDLVALWFAVGSGEPPHLWNGIRVFPLPAECLGSPDFLRVLIGQQRPSVVVSNVPWPAFPSGLRCVAQSGLPWVHRLNPTDTEPPTLAGLEAASPSGRRVLVAGRNGAGPASGDALCVPYLSGLDAAVEDGDEPTAVLRRFEEAIATTLGPGRGWRPRPAPDIPAGVAVPASTHEGQRRPRGAGLDNDGAPCFVMRQHLFCNASVAQVMFELTNALIELGVPTVAQEEQTVFSKAYMHREDEFWRAGAPAQFERIQRSLGLAYDPETAVTVHFSMFKPGVGCARFGVFQAMTPREVLYTTGNHTVTPEALRQQANAFEMILGPSRHVLRPYLEAGLSPSRGAVVPHGIDPEVFFPGAPALPYATRKRFKFLQTSFPWVVEKGFDLTISAFCRAFSSKDDVALILRTPRIRQPSERDSTFGRLEALVQEAAAQPGAPEILLVESDVELNRRGGVYTGADCYVFPLRAEGFAMTILEAMACGLPVIATPWSGPADFLSPRYTHMLRHSSPVPERSSDGAVRRFHVEPELDHLVHLMRRVYEQQDEAKAMGLAGAEVVRSAWTWKHAAAKLASIPGLAMAREKYGPSQLA